MISWHNISTVFLDMDGTLLDLRFDNHFWLEYLPQAFAGHHSIELSKAQAHLHNISQQTQGSLQWYCLDYWSQTLGVNIQALKREIVHLISERPDVLEFLEALLAHDLEIVLVTNAHPDSLQLKLKHTQIKPFFRHIVSAHELGLPKEDQNFWSRLALRLPFEPARTLLIDDNEQVLLSAAQYGMTHLFTIAQPDSRGTMREKTLFPAINQFKQVLPVFKKT